MSQPVEKFLFSKDIRREIFPERGIFYIGKDGKHCSTSDDLLAANRAYRRTQEARVKKFS